MSITFESMRMTKTAFLTESLGRVENEVGIVLSLIEKYNKSSPRKIGFWAGIRLLMPPIETISETLGINRYDFLKNNLDIKTPHLAWQMFRHSLTHGDLMRHAEYKNKKVGWGIAMMEQGNVIGLDHIGLDVFYIYKKLIQYLKTVIPLREWNSLAHEENIFPPSR